MACGMGQMVQLVLESDSGIKNPSEAGDHSTGYALLGATGGVPTPRRLHQQPRRR